MKTTELINAEATNAVFNAETVDNLEGLKESGKARGGIRLLKGQTITFADELSPELLCITRSKKGNPIYYVKALIDDARATWIAVGSFRKKPADMQSLNDYPANLELASMENDYELLLSLQGKTLKVVDVVPMLYVAFDSTGGMAFVEKVVDGKTITEPVYREQSTPIFEKVEKKGR